MSDNESKIIRMWGLIACAAGTLGIMSGAVLVGLILQLVHANVNAAVRIVAGGGSLLTFVTILAIYYSIRFGKNSNANADVDVT